MIQSNLSDPGKLAEAAEEVYRTKYKNQYEETHFGQYLVIDIKTNDAYVGEYPEGALQTARESAPYGIFHLIRIGAPGAFKVNHVGKQDDCWDWPLRRAR